MSVASRFIEALRRLEATHDVEPMAALFAPGAELGNPQIIEVERGPEGARRFWDAYRRTFRTIESEFRRVVESEGASMLEWVSRGVSAEGTPFTYEGVSVLEHPAGFITRFHAYFDPRSLGEQLQLAS